MSLNESNNINNEDFYSSNGFSNELKNFTKNNPLLTKSLIASSALTTASIISPTIRKITIPTCKFVAKKQLNLLAGIGVLSIANYMIHQSDNIEDTLL